MVFPSGLLSCMVHVGAAYMFTNIKYTTTTAIIQKGTHNADSIMESKVIYYLEQCGLGV